MFFSRDVKFNDSNLTEQQELMEIKDAQFGKYTFQLEKAY